MAELVDALVSNTSGSNAVGVQFPLRVLKKSESESECVSNREHSYFFDLYTYLLREVPPLTSGICQIRPKSFKKGSEFFF
jgi:hypothetical protein